MGIKCLRAMGIVFGCFAGFVWILFLLMLVLGEFNVFGGNNLMVGSLIISTLVALPCLVVGYKEEIKYQLSKISYFFRKLSKHQNTSFISQSIDDNYTSRAYEELHRIQNSLAQNQARLADAKAKGESTVAIEASIRACEEGISEMLEKYK